MGDMKENIPVLQIAGFKKSGKTTFLKKVLKKLSDEGYRVGVIKHHGHGGPPDLREPEHTDTAQFQNEGAYLTAVEGDGVLHMKVNDKDALPLSRIVSMYQLLPLDLILVEGYKKAAYQKFLIVRNRQERNELLDQCVHVIGLITHHTEELDGLHHFKINQTEDFTDYIIEEIIKRR